jgi:hypothetical protein
MRCLGESWVSECIQTGADAAGGRGVLGQHDRDGGRWGPPHHGRGALWMKGGRVRGGRGAADGEAEDERGGVRDFSA